eukprot:530868_1
MGCCASNPKTTDTHKSANDQSENRNFLRYEGENGTHNITVDYSDDLFFNKQNHHKKHSEEKSKHYKILLLGPGQSGKTTIFKQMRQLHGHSYARNEFINCKPHLTANLIEAFRKLCIYSDILAEQSNRNGEIPLQTKVSASNRDIRDCVARLNDREDFNSKLLNMFERLLSDSGIIETLKHRYQFQLSDNFDYLIRHMHLYCEADYIPTYSDYLQVKQRTVGIQKLSFKLISKNDNNRIEYYDIHDAGGQRTERKKWLNVIKGATAYIFVTAISGYNQSLWEEPSYNRMREAIHLFRRIYHMDALRKAHVILFLNKYDLFETKIVKYSIKETFKEYDGKETPEAVSQFIVNKFKEQQDPKYGKYMDILKGDDNNGHNNIENIDGCRSIYFHFTSATDTECVNRVFEICRDIIVLNTLTNIGFL